jgi:hypothetical protein
MTEYIDFKDLKAALIGIIVFFICVGIQRYWSNRSIKNMRWRIELAEAEKAHLANLATSEKALLIMGLQGIFAILGLMCLIFFFQTVQSAVLRGEGSNPYTMLILFLWGTITMLSMYASDQMKKVGKYPGSLESIDKRIQRLKNKLLGRD